MSMYFSRIVLHDDDPALLQALCDILTRCLRSVVVADQHSSDDVVVEIRQGNFDVMVRDFRMPRQGGLKSLAGIKR